MLRRQRNRSFVGVVLLAALGLCGVGCLLATVVIVFLGPTSSDVVVPLSDPNVTASPSDPAVAELFPEPGVTGSLPTEPPPDPVVTSPPDPALAETSSVVVNGVSLSMDTLASLQQRYGGYIGSDGNTSYFFDPDSGCSVIPGGGVSC